jgi:hypothetical protein
MPASRSLHKIVQFVLGIAQYLRGAVETLGAMCFPEVKNRYAFGELTSTPPIHEFSVFGLLTH